jgi:8-oxo-dGTP pyrophosphatase MutT (NUDIX family)
MTDWFLAADTPLHLDNAVAALIVVAGSGYLLQRRDNIPQIFFPDHWGLFGGAIDPGETPDAALQRELREELMLDVTEMTRFGEISFEVASVGRGSISRIYFEVPLTEQQVAGLTLCEGAAMAVFPAAEALTMNRVKPYDGFALWLHHSRSRLR